MDLEFEGTFYVDEIIDAMDEEEKIDMYNSLAEELSKTNHDQDYDVAEYFTGGLYLIKRNSYVTL